MDFKGVGRRWIFMFFRGGLKSAKKIAYTTHKINLPLENYFCMILRGAKIPRKNS